MAINHFFDIYQSPIVTKLFSSRILKACPIRWAHEVETSVQVSGWKTSLEINRENDYRCYSALVAGQWVAFTFCGAIGERVDVDFMVNHSFTRKELSRKAKIAIVRWLLAVWKLECTNYSIYVVIPSGDVDAEGSQWRGECYARLGFKWVSHKVMELHK